MDKHSFPLQEEATEQTPLYGYCFFLILQFVRHIKLLYFICKT